MMQQQLSALFNRIVSGSISGASGLDDQHHGDITSLGKSIANKDIQPQQQQYSLLQPTEQQEHLGQQRHQQRLGDLEVRAGVVTLTREIWCCLRGRRQTRHPGVNPPYTDSLPPATHYSNPPLGAEPPCIPSLRLKLPSPTYTSAYSPQPQFFVLPPTKLPISSGTTIQPPSSCASLPLGNPVLPGFSTAETRIHNTHETGGCTIGPSMRSEGDGCSAPAEEDWRQREMVIDEREGRQTNVALAPHGDYASCCVRAQSSQSFKPVHHSTAPFTSSLTSCIETSLSGGIGGGEATASSHIQPPLLQIRAKGLLERRGSNASLTLDLVAGSASIETSNIGSPPKESSVEEEYLMSASNRLSSADLCTAIRRPVALHQEFWDIPMNHPEKIQVPGSAIKNRYRTIIPNENTRVKLNSSDNLSSYINANYIKGYGGEQKAFIATQGPMSNTVNDFWNMIWQERSPAIVMITKLQERNRNKCECYLPDSDAMFGEVRVTVSEATECDGYVVRHIIVTRGGVSHDVTHFWYTSWPDHKTPETSRHLLRLISEVNLRRRDPLTNRITGPITVHCSAGIGRTGCFIAIFIGAQQLKRENCVDVLSIVAHMRLDRGGMVQSNEQYEYIYQVLNLYEQDFCQNLRKEFLQLDGNHDDSWHYHQNQAAVDVVKQPRTSPLSAFTHQDGLSSPEIETCLPKGYFHDY